MLGYGHHLIIEKESASIKIKISIIKTMSTAPTSRQQGSEHLKSFIFTLLNNSKFCAFFEVEGNKLSKTKKAKRYGYYDCKSDFSSLRTPLRNKSRSQTLEARRTECLIECVLCVLWNAIRTPYYGVPPRIWREW